MAGAFLPFLPQDSHGQGLGEADVAELISSDLGGLLRKDAKQFWAVVRSDASLKLCLDTFLQFYRCVLRSRAQADSLQPTPSLLELRGLCRRPHDTQASAFPPSAATEQLYKRVFLVFLRL